MKPHTGGTGRQGLLILKGFGSRHTPFTMMARGAGLVSFFPLHDPGAGIVKNTKFCSGIVSPPQDVQAQTGRGMASRLS